MKSAAGATTFDEGIQDTTAENLFRELKAESDTGEPTDEFEGVSAESIVSDADGHEHEQFTDGGQTIAAESEVENLLIPDRSEGEEFHWVDPKSTKDGDDADTANETTLANAPDATDLFETPEDDGTADGRTESDAALEVIGEGPASDESADETDAGGAGAASDETDAGGDGGRSRAVLAHILSFLRLW